MAKINSRSKGNRAERVAAEVLGKWTGKKFARVPSSGGLQWKNTNAKGDIVCTEEGHFFPFCVEVKNYREINFEHLLYSKKAKIMEFWQQCERDAKIANKIPLLMMRYDGLPSSFFFIIFKRLHQHELDFVGKGLHVEVHNLIILTTNDFQNNPYKVIKPLAKSICKLLKNGHK